MTKAIVDNWLARFVSTALSADLANHMAMISREVLVFGVPGFDALDYDDWHRQCEHEFPQRLLRALDYGRVRLRTADDAHILFKAVETTVTAGGQRLVQPVEMLIEHAEPGWQLKQMRLLPADEARHDGLI